MKKILFIGSQHGDETIGVRLYSYLLDKRPDIAENLEYYCANPLAFALHKRFIDTDMNRSFQMDDDSSYDAKRAHELRNYIEARDYDYILDLHTTTTDVGICFITKERSSAVNRIINMAPDITNIIEINKELAATSLLDVGENVVAIEVNVTLSYSEATLQTLLQLVDNLSSDSSHEQVERSIFRVQEFIGSQDVESGVDLKNFTEYDGRYPVLSGGDAKTRTYKGFWATRETGVLI